MNRLYRGLVRCVVPLVSAVFLTAPSSAAAKLVIRSEFIPSRPPANPVGGGNLVYIFNTAAAQWLFVVRGQGVAIIENEQIELRESTLILIRRGETHEIRNTGREPLRTLNLYIPPAYTSDGEELPAGKP